MMAKNVPSVINVRATLKLKIFIGVSKKIFTLNIFIMIKTKENITENKIIDSTKNMYFPFTSSLRFTGNENINFSPLYL
jgi:hypothetical protein